MKREELTTTYLRNESGNARTKQRLTWRDDWDGAP